MISAHPSFPHQGNRWRLKECVHQLLNESLDPRSGIRKSSWCSWHRSLYTCEPQLSLLSREKRSAVMLIISLQDPLWSDPCLLLEPSLRPNCLGLSAPCANSMCSSLAVPWTLCLEYPCPQVLVMHDSLSFWSQLKCYFQEGFQSHSLKSNYPLPSSRSPSISNFVLLPS